jgi:protein-disulfide isomerase
MALRFVVSATLFLILVIGFVACQANDAGEAVEAPLKKDVAAMAKRADEARRMAEEGIAPVEATTQGEASEFTPPKPVTLDLEPEALAFAVGDPEAPVQIVEFTDYQCPFCARHAFQTMPGVVEKLVETDRVFYAIKDLPLDAIHPEARSASVAARCAGEQDAYLAMHDTIFAAQADWSGSGEQSAKIFAGLAKDLELDVDAFEACVADGSQAAGVQANFEEAMALNVNSTPFFFLNGYAVSGAQPYELFEMAVELAESGRRTR